MAFEGLTQKLQAVFNKLKSRGRLSEQDVRDIMSQVRTALLEADVSLSVVNDFIARVTERAVGNAILESLSPGQQVIKVVNEELITLMGSRFAKLTVSSAPPTIIMLVGLQGSGKTTMAAKLALHLKKSGKRPMLAACDIYRPAAIEQLRTVAKQADAVFFEQGTANPVDIAAAAVKTAYSKLCDTVILDTAGRLHIDDDLMKELENIKAKVKPHEILLVVDAMTGQDAVNVAKSFNDRLSISGVLLTKLDGDTRGGAALSVKAVTGKPIKFVGVGEKIADIEQFHPDRMASRILGMGDVLSLIEKAQEQFDEKKAEQLEKKIQTERFDLEDYLDQLRQLRKMGPLGDVLGMMPGVKPGQVNTEAAEKDLRKVEAVICSMTAAERQDPDVLNASRRKRIAAGSGTQVQDVNRMIKQFEQARQMMKQLGKKGGKYGGFGNRFPM